jgi:Fic family protein
MRAVAALPRLTNATRSAYLALHSFHSTGLEGNTLTLPETLLTVAGQSLLGGFDVRVQLSSVATLSETEARNAAQLWSALDLVSLPGRVKPPFDLMSINVTALEDLNSAITRDTGTPAGLRSRAVGIGHRHVLLPMPDEVPVLVEEYLAWLRDALAAVERDVGGDADALLSRALALACDAHTRYVFVHPFMDGNGRLARTLSALVLQRLGLPAAMIVRSLRHEYMEAVSSATIDCEYAPLALVHAVAVRRSLACLLILAAPRPLGVDDARLPAALLRGDCSLSPDSARH